MKTLKEQGFYIEGTGGGCSAWVKKLSNGGFIVLTCVSGCTHKIEDKALIGIYDGSEDELWGNVVDSFEVDFSKGEL